MPIPAVKELLLPVLRAMGDGLEHSSQEIRARIAAQFGVTPQERLAKHKNGTPVFNNRVAWALAHLNMGRGPLGHSQAISRITRERYVITEHGSQILKRDPRDLDIKDL